MGLLEFSVLLQINLKRISLAHFRFSLTGRSAALQEHPDASLSAALGVCSVEPSRRGLQLTLNFAFQQIALD